MQESPVSSSPEAAKFPAPLLNNLLKALAIPSPSMIAGSLSEKNVLTEKPVLNGGSTAPSENAVVPIPVRVEVPKGPATKVLAATPKSTKDDTSVNAPIDVDAYIPRVGALGAKPSHLPERPSPQVIQGSSLLGTSMRTVHRTKEKPVYIDVDALPSHSKGSKQGKFGDVVKQLRTSPPPDPRSLAYISSGPSSNPLGIRPSSQSFRRTVSQPVPPTLPSTTTTGRKKKKKKPVKVGSGWPYAPTSGGGVNLIPLGVGKSSSSVGGSQTQVTMVEEPGPSVRPIELRSNLRNILSYSSPSPPPVAKPTPQPNNRNESNGKHVQVRPSNGHVPPNPRLIKAGQFSFSVSKYVSYPCPQSC